MHTIVFHGIIIDYCVYHLHFRNFLLKNVFLFKYESLFFELKSVVFYQSLYTNILLSRILDSGGAGDIASQGQIYMGAPIGVVEIHLRVKMPPL